MIDGAYVADGLDLGIYDTQAYKAGNILNVQLGSLEYAPDLGIDLKYFLSSEFKFQNESFKSYCVETLANRGVNVSSVTEEVETLFNRLIFNIKAEESSTGLIAR